MMRSTPLALAAAAALGLTGLALADQVTSQTTTEQTTVTQPQAAPQAVPPAAAQNSNDISSAPNADQDIAGTVQSVDRRNKSIVLQNGRGENVGITFNDNWHAYRRGQEIQYRDIEPNDHVMLLYRSAS